MGKLYMARHGQTQWNAEDRICGIVDLTLTEEGLRQAEALAEKAEALQLDRVITSAMKRARQTGAIIGARLGIPVEMDARLAEINFGKYEGAPRNDPGYHRDKLQFACRYEGGGESTFQAVQRLYNCLDEIREKYEEQNVLLVAHGSACRILHTYFTDVKNEDFFRFYLDNCEAVGHDWPAKSGTFR